MNHIRRPLHAVTEFALLMEVRCASVHTVIHSRTGHRGFTFGWITVAGGTIEGQRIGVGMAVQAVHADPAHAIEGGAMTQGTGRLDIPR